MIRRLLAAISFSSCFFLGQVLAATPELNKSLYESVLFMDAAKVKELLAKGADANYAETNRSLLGWAAQNGNVEIVEALLAAKANPNFVDGVGHTPLMRAVETQQTKVVEAILRAKPDLKIDPTDGDTLAMMAVESRKPEIVKLLLDAGVDFSKANADGDSPALTAAQDGMSESLEIIKLMGQAKVNLNHSNAAYTALFYAVNQENKELVKALLDAGADPNVKTQSGRTPLAESMANPEILQLLLAAKADPNITNDRGETALFAAIESDSAAALDALIKAGADVNKKDNNGNSPLLYASNSYKTELAEVLKKNGAAE